MSAPPIRDLPSTAPAAPAGTAAITSIADPGPLGLAGFAMTTFFLSSVNAGWLSGSAEGVVLGLALFYGGLAQLLAGMWEFVKGNTFGAVAFTSYGAFWMSFWYLVAHVDLTKAAPGDASKGVGFFLLGWAIFTLYMLVASLRTTGAIALVFALLFLTFLFLALGELNTSTGLTKIGGYLGLLTALAAWYASFAAVVNFTFKRAALPVFAL